MPSNTLSKLSTRLTSIRRAISSRVLNTRLRVALRTHRAGIERHLTRSAQRYSNYNNRTMRRLLRTGLRVNGTSITLKNRYSNIVDQRNTIGIPSGAFVTTVPATGKKIVVRRNARGKLQSVHGRTMFRSQQHYRIALRNALRRSKVGSKLIKL